MAIISGVVLVLLSWAVLLVAAMCAGLLPALGVTAGRWRESSPRAALWWGVGFLVVLITAVSLVLPLRSAAAAVAVLSAVGALAVAGIWAVRRSWVSQQRPAQLQVAGQWILGVGVGSAILFLALAALGPVTNYDSGLYHLGAIAYAGDYRAIPGLANLYFPFGYANAHFPVAAFLGNGPWDGIGYRLLNGALITALVLDLWLRARARRFGPGFFILSVGAAALLVPMVALADYWVTSPTSDSAVFVLSLVSAAYLTDAVGGVPDRWAAAAVAVVTAVVTVLLRPTMAVYAVVTVVVVVVLVIRAEKRGSTRVPVATFLLPVVFIVVSGLVITARDIILSGWLQYPLSLVAVDVPWRAADPTPYRVPTLGAARDPENLWAAAVGWDWVPGWIERLPRQWEVLEFAALALAVALLFAVVARAAVSWRPRALVVAVLPSLIAIVFWWLFTPPSFRFIWGPMFSLAAVPAGWLLWRLASAYPWADRRAKRVRFLTMCGVGLPVAAVVVFTAVFRFEPSTLSDQRTWDLGVRIPYSVAPVADVPVSESTLPSGITVLVPLQSDQCWLNYPLCTPQVPDTVSPRGEGLQSGFLP